MTEMSPIPREDQQAATDVQVLPVPEGMARPFALSQPHCVASYDYRDTQGRLLAIIARFERAAPGNPLHRKKSFVPYSCWRKADGSHVWDKKSLPAPRPLYGLPALLAQPEAVVVVSEGEKAAHAAAQLFPDAVSVTWMSGAMALDQTDVSPLAGRNVILLPDNDAPGADVMKKLADKLRALGMTRLRRLDIAALAQEAPEVERKGYDLADALEAGLDAAALADRLQGQPELICDLPTGSETAAATLGASEPDEEGDDPVLAYLRRSHGDIYRPHRSFSLSQDGVYKRDGGSGRRGEEDGIYLCSPLAVIGHTCTDREGAGWGYLVTFPNPKGDWETVVVPNCKLSGDGQEVRSMLMQRGLRCALDRVGRQFLGAYIQFATPNRTIRIVSRPGWVDDAFALPGKVIGQDETEMPIMLDLGAREHLVKQDGEMDDWKAMARLAEANSRAALALSAAFAAPLLTRLGEPGGGLHFHAKSSRGKTTMLRVAGSVWGGGGETGFARSWRTTDNALEGIAVDHNDMLLCIDEIGLAPTERLGEIAYMLASGQGKARSSKTGQTQPTARWRTFVLSSGEDPVATRIEASAAFRRSGVQAGTSVRFIDVPMLIDDATSFEDLAGFADERSFTRHLIDETDCHYGWAGPAFLEAFLADPKAHEATAREMIEAFIAQITTPEDDPQVQRVARQFAVIAAAGTLACRWEVLPWDREESALEAAATCFEAWKAGRDTTKSAEELDAIRTLKLFFELHGASRFENLEQLEPSGPPGEADDPLCRSSSLIVHNRCGYRLENREDGGITYFVTDEAWKTQVCADRDARFVAHVAKKCGALIPGEGGRLTKNKRLPGRSGTSRVYWLQPDKLP